MNQKRDMQYKKRKKGVKRPIISCSIDPRAHELLNKYCKRTLLKRSTLVNKLIIDYLKKTVNGKMLNKGKGNQS